MKLRELDPLVKIVFFNIYSAAGRTGDNTLMLESLLDGDFSRSAELDITEDELKKYGWNGDKQDSDSIGNALHELCIGRGWIETTG